jgi:hypothetical protein
MEGRVEGRADEGRSSFGTPLALLAVAQEGGQTGLPVWQRNYYEHVIRDEPSLDVVRRYVVDNPARWAYDSENPQAAELEPADAWRV